MGAIGSDSLSVRMPCVIAAVEFVIVRHKERCICRSLSRQRAGVGEDVTVHRRLIQR